MKKLRFEWDTKKDKINIKKHSISFDDASTVFYDEYAIQFFDPEHSDDEDRFIILGSGFNFKTLIVCHCFREEETVIRIISARKADKDEDEFYWGKRK